jgi:Flp pilus assembly protein TadG
MSSRLPHLTLAPLRSRLRRQDGQAVVEFAIVLPVLLLIILGILYFGRYESYSSQMTQLAEEGARDAAVDYAYPYQYQNLAAWIAGQATGELAAGNGSTVQQVSVDVDCGNPGHSTPCMAGANARVCVSTQVQFPGLNGVGGVTIEQSATMRVEQTSPPCPLCQTAGPGLNNYDGEGNWGPNPDLSC